MSESETHPILDRLRSPGPKRILSLDGGGIRGAISLGYLAELEAHLRRRHGNPNLLLCDYFDLIGGTSTGSIIAAALAKGMNVAEILQAYSDMGDRIFEHPARWWQVLKWVRQNLFYKNKPQVIEEILRKFFKTPDGHELMLGDRQLRTGLCIVTMRVDTFSVWFMHNNPLGKYYAENKDIPLWRLVRASSAAPTFFPPKIMPFDNGGRLGAFVDGGVSAFNNPAMQLYLMATLKGYRLEWPAGDDKLMIVSVGTGTSEVRYTTEEVRKLGKKSALFWGSTVPDMFIRDASEYNELLMQSLSDSPTARKIDGEVGTLAGDQLAGRPMIHYLRYNAVVTQADIEAAAKLTQQDRQRYPSIRSIEDMMRMDAGDHVFQLADLGHRNAKLALSADAFDAHFPKAFDLVGG